MLTSIFSKKINAQVNESIFTINITGGVLEGSLISQPSKNKLAIIIAGSGPTDRNGNNPLNVKANSYKMLAEELNKEKESIKKQLSVILPKIQELSWSSNTFL